MANKRTTRGAGNSSAVDASRRKAKAQPTKTSSSEPKVPQSIKDALKRLEEAGSIDMTNSDDFDTIAFIGYPGPPPETSKPGANGQEP